VELNISYDSSVTNAPAGFTTAVAYVVNLFDSLFVNSVIINIDVGWGEIDGSSLASGRSARARI
jgi:hypothetical protein